jgi:hypothetical protein
MCRENSSFIQISREQRVLYMKTNIRIWSHLAQFLLEWKMFRTNVAEKIKTHILCSKTFFFFENHAFHAKTWKYIVERGRPQMTIQRMRIAWCIPNTTNTPSEYIILIASPLQQSLHERASVLGDTYIACYVITTVTHQDDSADSWVSVCSACEQIVINRILLTAAPFYVVCCVRK